MLRRQVDAERAYNKSMGRRYGNQLILGAKNKKSTASSLFALTFSVKWNIAMRMCALTVAISPLQHVG